MKTEATQLPFKTQPHPAPIQAPAGAGRWHDATTWRQCYSMLCMMRGCAVPSLPSTYTPSPAQLAQYHADRSRCTHYEEAIRQHVLSLNTPEARQLIRRDTNRTAIHTLVSIVERAPYVRQLFETHPERDNWLQVVTFLRIHQSNLRG